MTTPGNPWRATACTNPRVIGATSVRGICMLLAGETLPADILITPTLITNDMLIDKNIANMNDLIEAVPAFSASDACIADWIPMK